MLIIFIVNYYCIYFSASLYFCMMNLKRHCTHKRLVACTIHSASCYHHFTSVYSNISLSFFNFLGFMSITSWPLCRHKYTTVYNTNTFVLYLCNTNTVLVLVWWLLYVICPMTWSVYQYTGLIRLPVLIILFFFHSICLNDDKVNTECFVLDDLYTKDLAYGPVLEYSAAVLKKRKMLLNFL